MVDREIQGVEAVAGPLPPGVPVAGPEGRTGRCSTANYGCAVDAVRARRFGFEPRRSDHLAAPLADAVGAAVELLERHPHAAERLAELGSKGFGLAAFRRDLRGVGEVGVVLEVAVVSEADLAELLLERVLLFFEQGSVVHGCIICHDAQTSWRQPGHVSACPVTGRRRPGAGRPPYGPLLLPFDIGGGQLRERARGWASSYARRKSSEETLV